MRKMPHGKYALVRDVPNTYDKCIKANIQKEDIRVELAKEQHRLYCENLRQLGLTLIRLKADDRLPDCCFAEDPAIVIEDKAIISYMGVQPRVAETVEVRRALVKYRKIFEIKLPATLEGGDVLKIDKKIYVGLSGRTNQFAVQQLESVISEDGYQIIPVEVRNALHLKSVCTYIGDDYVVLLSGCFEEVFSEYKIIKVPREEAYSANCLSINGKVMLPKGYPVTKRLVENEGFEIIDLEMSEFRKGDGGLTCLSIIF